MIQRFLFFTKFPTYLNKPHSWLHHINIYKLWGFYVILLVSSIKFSFLPNEKLLYLVIICICLSFSLCIAPEIWQRYDLYLITFLILLYIFLYYKTQSYLLSILKIKNTSSLIPIIISKVSLSPYIYRWQPININIDLYLQAFAYLIFSRLFLLTITSEELVAFFPSIYSHVKFKIIIVLTAQSLTLKFRQQNEIVKVLKSRGNKDLFSLLLIGKLYILSNLRQNRFTALVFYSRNQLSISTKFLNLDSNQYFANIS